MRPSTEQMASNPVQTPLAAWNVNTRCLSFERRSVGWQTSSCAKRTSNGCRLIFGDFHSAKSEQETAHLIRSHSERIARSRCSTAFVDVLAEARQETPCRVRVTRTVHGNVYGLFGIMGGEQSVEIDSKPGGQEGKMRKRSNSLHGQSDVAPNGADASSRNGIRDANWNTTKSRLKRSNTVHASASTATATKGFRDRIFTSPPTCRSPTVARETRENDMPPGSAIKQLVSRDRADGVAGRTPQRSKVLQEPGKMSPIASAALEVGSLQVKDMTLSDPSIHSVQTEGLGESSVPLTNRESANESPASSVNTVFIHESPAVAIIRDEVNSSPADDVENIERLAFIGSDSVGQVDSSDHAIINKDEGKEVSQRPQTLDLPTKSSRSSSLRDMSVMTPEEELAAALAVAERNRRSSDSSALKQEHVRRSEQFSEMLRHLKSKGTSSGKLSPYGLGILGAISESRGADLSPKPRRAHNKEYFDAWLKDQSERISTLRGVLGGDTNKLDQLRHKVRKSPLSLEDRHFGRSKSMKLPRRVALMSDEDEKYPSDSEASFQNRRQLKKHNSDSEAMRKQRHRNVSSGDRGDVELLGDSEGPKDVLGPCTCPTTPAAPVVPAEVFTVPKKEGIVFSKASTSSLRVGANVAVVKPMLQVSEKRTSQISSKNVVTAYHVSVMQTAGDLKRDMAYMDVRRHDNDLTSPSSRSCAVSTTSSESCCSMGEIENAVAGSLREASEGDSQYEHEYRGLCMVEPVASFKSSDLKSHVELPSAETTLGICSLEADKQENSCPVAENTESASRISASLSQLMGELRMLRSQDVDLAKQLIGLGKSIRRFRQERARNMSISEAVEEFADESDSS